MLTAKSRGRRWGDNDHQWGPFTWATKETWRPWLIMLDSGDDDEHPGCHLRIQGLGATLIIELPSIIQPWRRKVYLKSRSAEIGMRLSRDWYYDVHEREFGFYISDGRLQINYGRQTDDSSTDQNWSWFLPWTQWRHIRRSWYGPTGQHIETLWDTDSKEVCAAQRTWLAEFEKTLVKTSFTFLDYDGEEIIASTNIEEREWRFGTGIFKWLSWFHAPRVSRYLDIDFSKETGAKKGSWKGGTMGHSIEIGKDELHEAAFRRYCITHSMVFVGVIK